MQTVGMGLSIANRDRPPARIGTPARAILYAHLDDLRYVVVAITRANLAARTRFPSQHSEATSADAWPTRGRLSTIETVSRHVGVVACRSTNSERL